MMRELGDKYVKAEFQVRLIHNLKFVLFKFQIKLMSKLTMFSITGNKKGHEDHRDAVGRVCGAVEALRQHATGGGAHLCCVCSYVLWPPVSLAAAVHDEQVASSSAADDSPDWAASRLAELNDEQRLQLERLRREAEAMRGREPDG